MAGGSPRQTISYGIKIMTMPLTRDAYRNLIREDLAWLESCPRTLERDHVIAIVKASESHEYNDQVSALRSTISRLNQRAHSGYDFNSDPDRITLEVGEALKVGTDAKEGRR